MRLDSNLAITVEQRDDIGIAWRSYGDMVIDLGTDYAKVTLDLDVDQARNLAAAITRALADRSPGAVPSSA